MYQLQFDGSVCVVNCGFDFVKGEWCEVVGKVFFVGDYDIGLLKVLFFGLFYGGYYVVVFDLGYCWALVVGLDCSYCWVLICDKYFDFVQCDVIFVCVCVFGIEMFVLIFVLYEWQDLFKQW